MPSTTAPSESAAALAAVRANPPAWLTAEQVSVILERTPVRIYQMIQSGILPSRRLGPRSVRISTKAFLAFIDGED